MKKLIYMTVMFAIVTLVGFSVEANAQRRVNKQIAKNLVKRIEESADKFKGSLDRNLDRSRIDDRRSEDRINDFVSEFEQATNQLRRNYDDQNAAQEVLRRGQVIDRFMQRARLSNNVENDWNVVRINLSQLANLYQISWNRNDDDRRDNNGRYDDRRDNNRRNNNRSRINYSTAENLIKNIENKADNFKRALDRDLDNSRVNNRRGEDRIKEFVSDFENATDRLRSDYKDDNRGSSAVSEVLQRGKIIDDAMRRLRGNSNSKRQWNSLRGDLSQLARLYNVRWTWGR